MLVHEITPDQLATIIAPFAGARLSPARNLRTGYYMPRDAAIDITAGGIRRRDADVREVTDEGIECFRTGLGLADPIAWDEITEVVVRGLDENGDTTSAVVFRPTAEQAAWRDSAYAERRAA